jgi:mannose-1-phosphate guanylyltransferase
MGTGGGIGLTRDFWRSGDFLVINADILSDVDLKSVREFHQRHGGPVTLVLHDYPLYNQIEVDGQGRIQRFRTGSGKGLAFAGIHFLNREIFGYLPASGSYDIIPVYQAMIDQGIPVRAYVSQGHYWRDLGTPPSYLAAHGEMLTKQRVQASTHSPRNLRGGERDEVETSGAFITQGRRVLIHPEAEVEEGVEYIDWAVAGRGCRLKKGCRIARSVLWENVVLNEGVSVFDSIVGDGVHLEEDIHSRVLV